MKPHVPTPCRWCGHDIDSPAPDHCTAPIRHVTGAPTDFRRRVAWFKTKAQEEK